MRKERMEPKPPQDERRIRTATASDAEQICSIYNHYVLNTTISFEQESVNSKDMRQRIKEHIAALPWLVWDEMGTVRGFCFVSKWKGRDAYRYSVESSVYLDPGSTGKGIGTRLYDALFHELRQRGLHVVIGGIALPNEPSVALHEKMGFRKVAHFEQVGWKFNRWIDVGYWQLFLSRDPLNLLDPRK
jgi:L-amino acid N-acyltransferase YncA